MKKIVIVLLGAFALTSCDQEKTAYVDNTVLIQDYSEMKTTEEKYTKRQKELNAELDSVSQSFQREVEEYQQGMDALSGEERQQKESELMQKQQQLQQQQQMKSQMLRSESDEEIDAIRTKIKDFVAEYGEENGYTYIFGSNESANIMYAKDGKDITQDILEKLNDSPEISTEKETEGEIED